jgi:O-Antigen ligase
MAAIDPQAASGPPRAQGAPSRLLLVALLAASLVAIALRGGSYETVARGQLFIVVWWTIGFGALFGDLPRHRLAATQRLALAALLLLAAWTALGLLWTGSEGRTSEELARVLGLTGVLLLVAWLFGSEDAARGVGVVTIAALAVCALALVSRLAPGLVASPLAQLGYDPRRLSYPFNYWNGVGCWSAMTVALALGASLYVRPAWLRGLALGGTCLAVTCAYLTYSRTAAATVVLAAAAVVVLAPARWRAALHVLAALAGSALVIAVVRGQPAIAEGSGTAGAGAVVVALAAVLAAAVALAVATRGERLDAIRLPRRVRRGALAATGVVVLALAVVAGPGLAQGAWDSFRGGEAPRSQDPARRLTSLGGERRLIWDVALDAFRAEPLRGIGAGTFEFAWDRSPDRTEAAVDAHSLYLEALAELGLPGALLVVLALGALLVGAVRGALRTDDPGAATARAGAAAALLVFCAFAGVDWMWESTAVAVLALVLAGLATAPSRAKSLARTPVGRRLVVLLLALVPLAAQLPGVGAADAISDSRGAAAAGRLREAYSDASRAVAVEPWSAEGWLQRALVLERGGRLPEAAADARAAAEREALNWSPWLVLARVEAKRGRWPAALSAARRARRLNPRSPVFAAAGLRQPGGRAP